MSRMRWRLAGPPDEAMTRLFPELHPLAVRLLWNRGVRTQEQADEFLLPDYGDDLHDPFLFRQMRDACERVWRALDKGERVVVYSDYDADGVTGAAIVISTLRALAVKLGRDPGAVVSHIPHREKDGYGVKAEAVEELCRGGMTLLITVDCGIGSAEEVARAAASGCDAIVVDHHQVPERVPGGIILHPDVPGETYPFKHLAAAGVAFKFACGLIRFASEKSVVLGPGFDKWLLDLVAIATVTDFMPLVGENRTLERWGLVVLNKTRRLGLRQLIRVAGLVPGKIDTYGVGFAIGPRLNAASRMDHAAAALDLLLAENESEAAVLAEKLDRLNRERQKVGEEIAIAAREMIAARGQRSIHVIAGDGWPAGVIGIIAGKMASESGVPVFIFSREGERFTGSGRSIPEYNVMDGLAEAGRFASRSGGHPQACGVTVEGEEAFRRFSEALETHADRVLRGLDLRPALDFDAELPLSEINWEVLEILEKFEPFGEGNRRPRFLVRDCRLLGCERVGRDGRHARLSVLGDSPRPVSVIAFGQAEAVAGFRSGDRLDIAAELGADEWNGNKRIQIKAVDMRAAENAATESGRGR